MAAPVAAKTEKWSVDDLVNSMTGLTGRGEVKVEDRAAVGLDRPTKVQITAKDGKSTELAFGSRSAVGDVAYVAGGDSGKVQMVSAEVLDKIEDPHKKYRDTRLVSLASNEVNQITVTRPEGELQLVKAGEKWEMTKPQKMPAESTPGKGSAFSFALPRE